MKPLFYYSAQDAAPSPGFDMKGSFDRVDADMNGFVNKMEFNALYNSFDDDGNADIYYFNLYLFYFVRIYNKIMRYYIVFQVIR